jgi:hypothetical protein
VKDDMTFNMYIRYRIRPGYVSPNLPLWFEKLLAPNFNTPNSVNEFCPRIYDLAITLLAVHPEVAEYMPAMVTVVIGIFREEHQKLLNEMEQNGFWNWHMRGIESRLQRLARLI